jgi:hypothetical protein
VDAGHGLRRGEEVRGWRGAGLERKARWVVDEEARGLKRRRGVEVGALGCC